MSDLNTSGSARDLCDRLRHAPWSAGVDHRDRRLTARLAETYPAFGALLDWSADRGFSIDVDEESRQRGYRYIGGLGDKVVDGLAIATDALQAGRAQLTLSCA